MGPAKRVTEAAMSSLPYEILGGLHGRGAVAWLTVFLLLPMWVALAPGCAGPEGISVEVFPRHFQLQPGERIHYTAMERTPGGKLRSLEDVEFDTSDARVLRLTDPRGIFEAMAPGRIELIVRSRRIEQRFDVEVVVGELAGMTSVHHSEVDEIVAEEVLFVGHANLDGYDHTAVAKAGIDQWVSHFKEQGRPVAYFMSEEYPNWYLDDREPDFAIISEGQEHQIRIDAERVVFTGGDFMFCLLRNAQMTLYGAVKDERRERIHFVFPGEAIWMSDVWGPGEEMGYPAPMMLLSALFRRWGSEEEVYDRVLVPFLDRLLAEFPVAGYPLEVPEPDLSELVEGWSVRVLLDDKLERDYRRGGANKVILMEFLGE